ncbi:hypothetical protein J7363_08220 [Phaeobacter italicus]|nr:hypothetical protein [Phaeobacter italicus]MEC8573154.1 hypothetical protein [Pseudomonadota bacterium]
MSALVPACGAQQHPGSSAVGPAAREPILAPDDDGAMRALVTRWYN